MRTSALKKMNVLSPFHMLKPLGVPYEIQEINDAYRCKLYKAIEEKITEKTVVVLNKGLLIYICRYNCGRSCLRSSLYPYYESP